MKNELHQRLMSLASSLHERKLIKRMLMKESAPPGPAGTAPATDPPAPGGENKAKNELEKIIKIEGVDGVVDELLEMNLSDVIESIKALEPKAAVPAPEKAQVPTEDQKEKEKEKGKKVAGKKKKGGTVSPQLAALPAGQILGAAVKQLGGIEKSPSVTNGKAADFIEESGIEGIRQLLEEEAIRIKILFLKDVS